MPRDIEMMVVRVLSLCHAIMSFPWALWASVWIPTAIHPSSEQRVLVSQLLPADTVQLQDLPRTESWAAVPSPSQSVQAMELHWHFSEIMSSRTA